MTKHFLLCACAQLFICASYAADKYWDTNGGTAGLQPGGGVWNTGSTALWSTDAAGTPLTTWSAGDDAFFRTAGANAVTVSGTVQVNSISQSVTGTATSFTGGVLQFGNGAGISNTGNQVLAFGSTGISINTSSLSVGGTVSIDIAGVISETGGSRGLTKTGSGTLIMSGSASNTYTGLTSLSGTGITNLDRSGGATAIAGDINISGGAKLQLSRGNIIANTSNITMSGAGSVYNGTAVNTGQLAVSETIASLTVTGGTVNAGTGVQTVTGAGSFTGGAGNTLYIGNSGSNYSFGSLTLTNMGATAGGTVGTANSFTLYGGHATAVSRLFVGSGGLTLNGSVINLRQGTAGSRLALGGNVTTTGSTSSSIIRDAAGGSTGVFNLELGESAGTVNRTFTVGATAPLLIGVPIVNGTSTTGGIVKEGTGTLTLTGANTYSGGTTINDGTVLVNSTAGTGTGAVSVTDSGTLGGTGTVTGAVTIEAGGALQGGTGLATEDLSLSGNVTLQNDSVIKLTLGVGGAHSSLTRTAGTWSFNSTQKFTFDDLGATAGLYNNIIAGVANPGSLAGWTITNSNWTGTFAYDGANIDFTLMQVPEPGSAVLLVAGLGVAFFRRRRSGVTG